MLRGGIVKWVQEAQNGLRIGIPELPFETVAGMSAANEVINW
jgi:hypothetical protein